MSFRDSIKVTIGNKESLNRELKHIAELEARKDLTGEERLELGNLKGQIQHQLGQIPKDRNNGNMFEEEK